MYVENVFFSRNLWQRKRKIVYATHGKIFTRTEHHESVPITVLLLVFHITKIKWSLGCQNQDIWARGNVNDPYSWSGHNGDLSVPLSEASNVLNQLTSQSSWCKWLCALCAGFVCLKLVPIARLPEQKIESVMLLEFSALLICFGAWQLCIGIHYI